MEKPLGSGGFATGQLRGISVGTARAPSWDHTTESGSPWGGAHPLTPLGVHSKIMIAVKYF
jgi:hypothetical protein